MQLIFRRRAEVSAATKGKQHILNSSGGAYEGPMAGWEHAGAVAPAHKSDKPAPL